MKKKLKILNQLKKMEEKTKEEDNNEILKKYYDFDVKNLFDDIYNTITDYAGILFHKIILKVIPYKT
jgi:hypothetical protein